MATVAESGTAARSEKRFFFIMACVMALVIVAGFSTNILLGRSSFGVPLVFHLHAFVFFGWVTLYLLQNGLIAADNVALHRRLGWLALLWVPAMVGLGIAMTIVSARKGAPFFFDANGFLFGNPIAILAFAGLTAAAIRLRRRTDWHRRLMFCGMAILTGPGLGRLLPMPLFIPWAWSAVFAVSLLFPLIGMLADRRRTGRVHPAWLWGVGVMLGAHIGGELLAHSPLGEAATRAVVAGTPGADRPLHAYLP
jgi:hypothetical protein